MWRAGSYEVTRPAGGMGPGTADESLAGQHRVRQPISGSGRPRGLRALGGGAEVAVDLAGDVALQAADDLLLRQALLVRRSA